MKKLLIASGERLLSELSLMLPGLMNSDLIITGCDADEIILPEGIGKVYSTGKEDPANRSAAAAAAAVSLYNENSYDLICFSSDADNSAAALMTAAELKLEIYPDITYLSKGSGRIFLRRRVYGGNIEAETELIKPAVISFAQYKAPLLNPSVKIKIQKLEAYKAHTISGSVFHPDKKENGLKSAKIVFAAGKGIGSRENYLRLKALAEKFGASCGASRAVILSGWADPDEMIGQSGTVCTPEICICFGVSGAAPFLIGVEQSARLIAINRDSSASIFKAADYGIISDCIEILGLMEQYE